MARVPVVLQAEAAECGLACLAMVAGAHGLRISLPELRRRFSLSLKGARLDQIIGSAAQLGLRARALRLDLDDLPRLELPCLLHWDLNHFVVLTRVRAQTCDIVDPARGEQRLPRAEFSRHFTGVALELAPERGFVRGRAAPPFGVRELIGPVRGLWPAAVRIVTLSLALQGFVLLAPMLLQWVIDQVLSAADRELLWVLVAGFALSTLLQSAITLLRGWAVLQLSTQLGVQWMSNIVAHLLRLPLEFFEKRHLGDITSRLGSLQSIQKTLTSSCIEVCIDGLMAVLTLALMLAYSPWLALVSALVMVAYLLARASVYRIARSRTDAQLAAAARQQTHLLESLRGVQSIKIAGREPLRCAAFDNLLIETTNREVRLGTLSLQLGGANQLLFGLERIAVIGLGAGLVLEQALSVGMLMAYLAYKDQFVLRASGLIDRLLELRMLRLHAERLADIVLAEPESGAAILSPAALQQAAHIDVRGLSFRYADGEPWILEDCDFTVLPGESVAIVGASGCGKSTLLKLLLGLLPASAGEIRIGGQDMRRGGARAIRERIGVVMQDDQLFAGCIADNISFFDPDADPRRIEQAARAAALHEDITAMPMGYSSLIGDMGSALSGGQRQRLLLARALYRRPAVLMLDEATSHLDDAREQQVNAAVRALRITRLIVAHRPQTVASADRVLCLERGRLRTAVAARAVPLSATVPTAP